MLFPGQIGDGLLGSFGFGSDPDPTGAGEGDVRAVGIEDLTATPAHKLIHIAGVVGEQHKRLEMFGWRTGVVTQARQREINAAGVKMRQRGKLCRMVDPVGGFIPNLRQLGGREVARQASAHGAVQRQFGTINHIRIGDLMARWLDGDVGTVILIQQR